MRVTRSNQRRPPPEPPEPPPEPRIDDEALSIASSSTSTNESSDDEEWVKSLEGRAAGLARARARAGAWEPSSSDSDSDDDDDGARMRRGSHRSSRTIAESDANVFAIASVVGGASSGSGILAGRDEQERRRNARDDSDSSDDVAAIGVWPASSRTIAERDASAQATADHLAALAPPGTRPAQRVRFAPERRADSRGRNGGGQDQVDLGERPLDNIAGPAAMAAAGREGSTVHDFVPDIPIRVDDDRIEDRRDEEDNRHWRDAEFDYDTGQFFLTDPDVPEAHYD